KFSGDFARLFLASAKGAAQTLVFGWFGQGFSQMHGMHHMCAYRPKPRRFSTLSDQLQYGVQ
ncbi:hypothetical protein, partial [Thalassospira lohafexi]|uniref:hypothetical protein n=1 Tax=Thalassospira lohafexi TaxID=744227 RepID=UPI0019809F0A